MVPSIKTISPAPPATSKTTTETMSADRMPCPTPHAVSREIPLIVRRTLSPSLPHTSAAIPSPAQCHHPRREISTREYFPPSRPRPHSSWDRPPEDISQGPDQPLRRPLAAESRRVARSAPQTAPHIFPPDTRSPRRPLKVRSNTSPAQHPQS